MLTRSPMVGGFLTSRLLRICHSQALIAHGSGLEFTSSVSSIFSTKIGRWEQFRYVGRGGGLDKWRQKRLQEKKALHREKGRQFDISQAKGQSLDNIADKTSNSYKSNNKMSHQGFSKERLNTSVDRFMKEGAQDLWNEDDGPLTTEPPSPRDNKTENNANSDTMGDSFRGGKVQRKDSLKDKSSSVLFSRSYSTTPRRGTKFGRVGTFREDEELDKEWHGSQPFDSVGDFEEEQDVGVNRLKAKSKQIKGKEPSRVGSISDEDGVGNLSEEEDVGVPKSKQRKVKDLNRSASLSDGEETGGKGGRGRAVVPRSLIEDEMELSNIIDEEMKAGMKFEEDLLRRRFYDDEDKKDFRRTKFSERGESGDDYPGHRSRERSSRNYDDEDKKDFRRTKFSGRGESGDDYPGHRSRERSFDERRSSRNYDDEDKKDFRRTKFSRRGESGDAYPGHRSRERSFDERRGSRNYDDEDKKDFRRTKFSGRGESGYDYPGHRSRERSFDERRGSRNYDDEDKKDFRRTKFSGRGESGDDYPGHRSRERSFDERRGSRKLHVDGVGASMSSCRAFRSKRQSVGGFDKSEEIGFHRAGASRRGRSLSSLSGSDRGLVGMFDLEKETEFGRLQPNRMGDFVSQYCTSNPSRDISREKTGDEDKERSFRKAGIENNWVKLGLRFKTKTSRDMEMCEDEEDSIDKQSLLGKYCKKEQPSCRIINTRNLWACGGKEEESYVSSSRCVVGRTSFSSSWHQIYQVC